MCIRDSRYGRRVTTSRRLHLDTRAVVLVIGCCAVWAMGQAMSKVALAQIPPVTQCGLRSLGGGLLVLLWTKWRGIRVWERDGTLWPGLLAGTWFAAEFACVYLCILYTSPSPRDRTRSRMPSSA